ncbi:MAG: hypothetical protein EXR07_10250 [Acetobacteraceae bacterium]|nr:hypothetical protein [Acetobacteraceae bacterium]
MGKNVTSDRLETYAKMHGGGRTYDFSQALAFKVIESDEGHQGKMYKMVLRNGQPMGGVCMTLCAFWLVFHAMQDKPGGNSFTRGRSVWDYLFKDGGLNMGAATNIVVEHKQSSGKQLVYFDSFLKQFGVNYRATGITGSGLSNAYLPFGYSALMAAGRLITTGNGYKMISLAKNTDGTGGGHAVSAWFDGRDVLFMDPNFGEFWLPNATAFHAWFQFFLLNTYMRSYKSLRARTYV